MWINYTYLREKEENEWKKKLRTCWGLKKEEESVLIRMSKEVGFKRIGSPVVTNAAKGQGGWSRAVFLNFTQDHRYQTRQQFQYTYVDGSQQSCD